MESALIDVFCHSATFPKGIPLKKKLIPTDPRFFWHVTVNTHIFFFGLTSLFCQNLHQARSVKRLESQIISMKWNLLWLMFFVTQQHFQRGYLYSNIPNQQWSYYFGNWLSWFKDLLNRQILCFFEIFHNLSMFL
jgi:hypothetical protein